MSAGGDGRKNFILMVKPVGAACNMRCSYCYYLKTQGSTASGSVMTDETLEELIRGYIEAVQKLDERSAAASANSATAGTASGNGSASASSASVDTASGNGTAAGGSARVISFTWHGGEPTLAGINFYRRAVALQKKYLPEGCECWNNLQTNGLLIDDAWCEFLAEEHFDVGVSIDGTKAVHDMHRTDVAGDPTWERVRAAVEKLKSHGLKPDLLCTVTADTARQGVQVYRALRELDTGWMQFIPIIVQQEDASLTAAHEIMAAAQKEAKLSLTSDSVTPELYGEFLKDVFAEWYYHDMGRTEVQLFSETALALTGSEPNLCWMRPTCGDVLIAERDGSVYACDHFVRPDYKIGALKDGLLDLYLQPKQQSFGSSKKDSLTAQCRRCPYLSLCGGGCLKDRFALSEDGEPGQYYLCPGLISYFDYAVPRLKRAMELSSARKSPDEIMRITTQEERAHYKMISRNDPCPCGSGRKFKNCCQRRLP